MALGGVEMGRLMPSEQARARTTAIVTGSSPSMPPARPIARGMSRLEAAEWLMTLDMASPSAPMTTTTARAGMAPQSNSPSSHTSRPVSPTPSPRAMPPATSHSTGHDRRPRSSPPMTPVTSRAMTARKPTTLALIPCRDSVIHSRIVAAAMT